MIELIDKCDAKVMQGIIDLETEAFGIGGLNAWHLVPLIRHGRVFMMRENQAVIGSVQYMLDWSNTQKAYMFGVSVAKNYRGKGIGTNLLKDSIKGLAGEGISEIELTVDPGNVGAIKVYEEKLGFTISEFRKNEYGEGEDRLVMNLPVKVFMDKSSG
ncbi:MAG TPA: GNAT family N-acetyltransferase [Negativicutes bacterium]|nr:GNAT family N-acetyltransferase [Negativicutes bacterium]